MDRYPYTNFHELNLVYFLKHFKEIFQQWDSLYQEMQEWKDATTEELETWKSGVIADIEAWEDTLLGEVGDWEDALMASLEAWKTAFETLFDSTFSDLEDIKTDAEAARDAAIAAQEAAEAAAASLELDPTLSSSTKAAQAQATGTRLLRIENGVLKGHVKASPLTSFSTGGINFSNGVVNDRTDRQHTDKFTISTGHRIFSAVIADGYKFGVFAHTGAGGSAVYHGAWNGLSFYTDTVWQNQTVFFGKLPEDVAYRWSFAVAKTDDSAITKEEASEALTIYYSTDNTLTLPNTYADAEAVSTAISNTTTTFETAISNTTTAFETAISATNTEVEKVTFGTLKGHVKASPLTSFSTGGINFSNGITNQLTTRQHTSRFTVSTGQRLFAAVISDGYKFGAFAHTGAGANLVYHGAWNGLSFYTDAVWQSKTVFFEKVPDNVDYRWSFAVAKNDDSVITSSEASEALTIYYTTDNTLSLSNTMADAAAVGTTINSLTPQSLIERKIPDYYFSTNYLPGRVAQILDNTKTFGDHNDSLIFFTDPHIYWPDDAVYNSMHGMALMYYVLNRANTSKIVCGGDVLGTAVPADTGIENLSKVREYYTPIWDSYYSIIGNHEFNNPSTLTPESQIPLATIYNILAKDKEYRYGGADDKGDYWIDNTIQNIRYIFLSCEYDNALGNNRVAWFGQTLLSTPADYYVCVLSHIGLDTEGEILTLFQPIADILDAAKTQTSITVNSVTYDFSSSDLTIIGVISGHNHRDYIKYTTEDVAIVSTTCDRGPYPGSSEQFITARPYNSVYEQAFDYVQIDIDNRQVLFTRIGGTFTGPAGSGHALENPDRSITF